MDKARYLKMKMNMNMKKYHSIILLLSSIVVFGCSLNEHKTEKPKGEKIVVQNKQKKEEKKR